MRSEELVQRSTALVVSEDAGLRDTVGRYLEADGFDVLTCPGPRAPHFSCIGTRGLPCPLMKGAELVVLDLHAEPGMLMDATARVSLVDYYRARAHRVLALVDEPDLPLVGATSAAVADRLTDPQTLVATVRELLGASQT